MRYGSRYSGPRRTKKIRSPIKVKDKVAKRGGRCAGCRGRYEVGDQVVVVRVKQRTYHSATCRPQNPAMAVGAGPMAGPVGQLSAAELVKALSAHWTTGEAQMVALLALENALVVAIKRGQMQATEAVEKAFDRYEKLKGMALRPGSDQEGKQAMKLATVDLVKLVFGA